MPLPPSTFPLPARRACLAAVLAGIGILSGCAVNPPQRPSAEQAGSGDEIALRAMSMIGKPYVWGGSSPQEGFDCSGLVHHVYETAAGIALPRQAARMSETGRRVSRSALQAGDMVFFNTQRRRYSHVGIYVGHGRFVHAPSRGKTIRLASLSNAYWKERYNGARRP